MQDDVQGIGDDAMTLGQEAVGSAEHGLVALRPFRFRAEEVGKPPRLRFTYKEKCVADPEIDHEPARKPFIPIVKAGG